MIEQLAERLTITKRYLLLINKPFIDINFHNYSNTQMKVYPKNSFDRFGDDLTELILQYLTFEDKVRLECVSKQWRRLVFNKQFAIEIFDPKSEHMNNFRQIPLISKIGFKIEERHNSLNKLLII